MISIVHSDCIIIHINLIFVTLQERNLILSNLTFTEYSVPSHSRIIGLGWISTVAYV